MLLAAETLARRICETSPYSSSLGNALVNL
jgi:hypothetical protein